MGETVERTEAPEQIHGVYADHRPVSKEISDYTQGEAVSGVVKGGDQNGGVRDIQIRVTGGQALIVEENGRGHGQAYDLEPRAVLEAHFFQSFAVFFEWPLES